MTLNLLIKNMKVVCIYNDPSNVMSGIPDNFDYGLEIKKEYLVMGITTFKESDNLYYLVDENGRPSWFPYQIFKIIENDLPSSWFICVNSDNVYTDYKNLIGFNELCNNEDYFNNLLEREPESLQVYFKRKKELESFIL